MRKRTWVDLLKDDVMEVNYHPSKANVVVDSLNRKSTGSVVCLFTQEKRILKEFDVLQIEVVLPGNQSYLAALQISSPLFEQIKQQ